MPGDRLPTEAHLMAQYGASRATVRKALLALSADGLAESVQGSGWYVRGDRRECFPIDTIDTARLTARDDNWHRWVQSLGRQASHHLEVRIEEPGRDIRRHLSLRPDELCVARRRIRLIDREPWMISTGYWPMWLAAGTPLAREGTGDAVDMRDPSPLKWAAQNGHACMRETNEIGSRMPTDWEADTLRMAAAVPVMTMFTRSVGRDGRAFRCTADIFPAHRFLLTVGRDQEIT
jgi:GntR family transcriptional regulator